MRVFEVLQNPRFNRQPVGSHAGSVFDAACRIARTPHPVQQLEFRARKWFGVIDFGLKLETNTAGANSDSG